MTPLEQLKKDNDCLKEQIMFLLKYCLAATSWSPHHTSANNNKYQKGTLVWYEDYVYECLVSNNSIPVNNEHYWHKINLGHLLAQEVPIPTTPGPGIYSFVSPLVETNEVVSILQATIEQDGYLSAIDWETFNNKQDALPTGGSSTQYLNGELVWTDFPATASTLAEVLFNGNETLGHNIKVNDDDAIELENTSLLKKGSYDFGGNGGISKICSVGYEDNWQAGIRYVFDNNGTIRNVTNGFTIIPNSSFDLTKRFRVGSLWTLDNGDTYECTNADLNAAVWVLTTVDLSGYIPYTGATQDVDLGLFNITAAQLIKDGGQPQQFLKADGSVDNNTYLTSADLPSTLDLFATTSPDPVISGYTALVRNITDIRYNTTAVDVSTPTITGTVLAPTFCGAVISDPSILLGNPGVFNFSVIGKIRRTGGSTSSGADFFFSIYKRNAAGVETLIADSAPVVVPANGGTYVEYTSIALWNDGIFLNTDRVVLKFYGIKTGGGTGAAYQFLFGGSDPVRGTAAISSAIIPNIYLKDIADVEKVPALDKEVLYWNDAKSLWEHSLTEDLVPLATATQKGLVSIGTQTLAGSKTFTSYPTVPTNGGNLGQGAIIIDNGSGLLQIAYNGIYPSLTELAYVKGVTSSIQTQINAVNVNVITITTAVSIDTDTVSGAYGQHGRHNKISNGANAINIQCVSTSNADFVASYEKIGTATITFTAGAGITLTTLSGTAAMTGVAGSKACLSRTSGVYYLQITNY